MSISGLINPWYSKNALNEKMCYTNLLPLGEQAHCGQNFVYSRVWNISHCLLNTAMKVTKLSYELAPLSHKSILVNASVKAHLSY